MLILCRQCQFCGLMIIALFTFCVINLNVQDHSSKESVLQTMPTSHIATAAASVTVHNKPAATSLPSPPVSLQIPATNPPVEPPVGFPAGQMYPSGFPPQLWTPTSE